MKLLCDLCDRQTNFGSGQYDGKPSALDNTLFFCNNCRQIHWDGIGPSHENKFVSLLEQKNIPLTQRNEKGWYPLQ